MVASPSAPQEALLVDGPSAPQEALRRAVAETLRNADFLVSLGVLVLTVHLWKLRVQLQRARSRGPPARGCTNRGYRAAFTRTGDTPEKR